MDAAWQILHDAGVPLDGGPRRAPVSPQRIADAVRAVIAQAPGGREAEALAAFALGWSAHWPSAYASTFNDHGDEVLAWAHTRLTDPNRYLKLRRIAIAHLARVL